MYSIYMRSYEIYVHLIKALGKLENIIFDVSLAALHEKHCKEINLLTSEELNISQRISDFMSHNNLAVGQFAIMAALNGSYLIDFFLYVL